MPTTHINPPARAHHVEALAAADQTPVPATLRECLLPLSNAALQTSVLAYKWGREQGQLMRASVVMDLCGDLIRQMNLLMGHTEGGGSRPEEGTP